MMRQKGKLIREMPDNYVVIDLETTGLSPRYDSIIEFVGIKINKGKIIDELSFLIKPFTQVSEFITNLTGITNTMLQGKPAISDVIDDIVNFIGDSIILGHNTHFDINFIYDNYKELKNKDFCNDYIDLLSITRKIYPKWKDHKLATVAKKLKTKTQPTHRAKNDCLATHEAYQLCKKYIYRNSIDFRSMFKNNCTNSLDYDITPNSKVDMNSPIWEKTVVFTGKLSKLSRQEAFQVVVNNGGKLGKAVTSKTHYLIMGNNDYANYNKYSKSIKQKKAEELMLKGVDIMILTENVFLELVGI